MSYDTNYRSFFVGLEETFSTTEEHPFWIDGQGWLKVNRPDYIGEWIT